MAQSLPTSALGSPNGDAKVLLIVKPPAGQIVVVNDVTSAAALRFEFSLEDVQILIRGEDVILLFADGSQILLPRFGTELVLNENPPQLYFGEVEVAASDVFGSVGVVELSDKVNPAIANSVTSTNSIADADPVTPVEPSPNLEGRDSQPDTQGAGEPPKLSQPAPTEAPMITPTPSSSSAKASSELTSVSNSFTSNLTGDESTTIKQITKIELYGYTENGFAQPSAGASTGKPPSLAVLQANGNVSGSDAAETLRGENYALVGSGKSVIAPRLTIEIDDKVITTGVITLNLPLGYSIVPGTGTLVQGSDATYQFAVTVNKGVITLDLALVYTLPSELGVGVNAESKFYEGLSGAITLGFSSTASGGATKILNDVIRVGVRAATSDDDLTYTDSSNSPWLVIPDHPGGKSINAAGGDDTIIAGAGFDTIYGGEGNDLVSYKYSGVGVSVILADGDTAAATVGGTGFAAGDQLRSIESLEGSAFNDTLTGNKAANVLIGGSGGDHLVSLEGADTLSGGLGANTLVGGSGNDLYILDGGVDTIVEAAGEGTDTVLVKQSIAAHTLAGNVENLIHEGSNDFRGQGNELDNSMVGGAGADTLLGGLGRDTLDGGEGNNQLRGGQGDDVYFVNAPQANTQIFDESGNDTIRTSLAVYTLDQNNGQTVENLIFTDNGGHSGVGNSLANILTGAAGNDTLQAVSGVAGGDTLLGGEGDDVLLAASLSGDSLEGQGGADSLLGATGADTLVGSAGADTIFGGDGADVLSGGDDDDVLSGGSGANTMSGGDGADSMVGGADKDVMSGGVGNDTLLAGDGANSMSGGDGADSLVAGLGDDTMSGDIGNDTLLAGDGANSMSGGDGADSLVASLGNDTMAGDDGDDTLQAGDGANSVSGGIGADSIVGGLGDDTMSGDDGNDTLLAGDGANSVSGGLGADILTGGDGTDSLVGGAGSDTLDGGLGVDRMVGGAGNDVYFVDSYSDVVAESATGGTRDEIRTALNTFTLAGNSNVEVLSYSGSGGFTGTGNIADQTFVSSAGDDSLVGGGGTGDALFLNYELTAADINAIRSIQTVGSGLGTYSTTVDNPADGVGSRTMYDVTGKFASSSVFGNTFLLDATKTTFILSGAGLGSDTTSQISYLVFKNGVLKLNSGAKFFGDQATPNTFDPNALGGTSQDDRLGEASNAGGTILADDLYGGQGDDTYVLNHVEDTAYEKAGEGTDTIILTNVFVGRFAMTGNVVNLGGPVYSGGDNVENLLYRTPGAFSVLGNARDNLIRADAANGGGAGNDTLSGDQGNDTLDGGAGGNSLIGGTGNDVYVINSASDQVLEAAGTDEIWMNYSGSLSLTETRFTNVENASVQTGAGLGQTSGTYTIAGNNSGNVLTGGLALSAASLSASAGDDTLVSRGGADSLDGGAGNDLYTIDNATYSDSAVNGGVRITGDASGTDTVRTNLASFTLADAANGGAGLANIENLVYFGSGTFAGTGNAAANSMTGSGSRMSLIGGSGRDTLVGGAGADTLDGGTSETGTSTTAVSDSLEGGAGDDWYIVNTTGDVVAESAAGGVDTIEIVSTGLLNASGNVAASAQAYTLTSSNVENLVYNGPLNITLVGNSLNNSIQGGTGNDSLSGNSTGIPIASEGDTLAGGVGNDTYFVDSRTDLVIENRPLDNGIDLVRTNLDSYTLTEGVENLTSINTTGSSLTGNALGNTITGSTGADTLDGGNDNGAADSLNGGGGDDYYILRDGDVISETGGSAGDTVELRYNPSVALQINVSNTLGGGRTLNLSGIENFVYAGDGAVTVTGSSLGNSIVGAVGDDRIIGGGGADTMRGGSGNDAYWIDVFSPVTPNTGSPAGDIVIEAAGIGGGGADTIYSTANYIDLSAAIGNNTAYYDNIEALAYVAVAGSTSAGSGAFTGIGNALDNTIVGGVNGPSSLAGGAGNDSLAASNAWADTLDGGTGADTMSGGGGNDLYIVDSFSDVVLEGGGFTNSSVYGTDTIRVVGLSTYDMNVGNRLDVENLEFLTAAGGTVSGPVTATGNYLSNRISGTEGNDSLLGGFGYDTLIGNGGNDTLAAGSNVSGAAYAPSGSSIAANYVPGSLVTTTSTALTIAFRVYPGSGLPDVGLGAWSQSPNFTTNTTHFFRSGSQLSLAIDTWQGNFTYNDDGTPRMVVASIDLTAKLINIYVDGTLLGSSTYSGTKTFFDLTDGLFAGNSGVLDDIRFYNRAISQSEAAAMAQNSSDTSAGGTGLLGYYNFDSSYANGSGTAAYNAFSGGGSTVTSGQVSLFGGSGNDSLLGGALSDVLDGGDGNDTMVGGTGSDTYYVNSVQDIVRDSGGSADSIYIGSGLITTYSLQGNSAITGTSEYLGVDTRSGASTSDFVLTGNASSGTTIEGSGGHDTLTGGTAADYLIGNSGNDSLTGLAGNDTLIGGAGADTLSGGVGNDDYRIDDTNDLILDATGTENGNDTVNIINTTQAWNYDLRSVPGGAEIENLIVTSSNTFSNTLTGTAANNTIVGGGGSDSIDAGDGDDQIRTSGGSDTMLGGNGNDQLWTASNNRAALIAMRFDGEAGADNFRIFGGSVTLSGSDYDTILDRTEKIDFTATNAGTAASFVKFTAADIQGIVGASNNSTLTISMNSSGAGIDYVKAETSAGVTVTPSGSTYIYKDASNTTIATLILAAS
jgi:Ca2+-binding RTX toxin-like protein